MAYFAKLDTNNIVLTVMAVDNNVLLDENGVEQEQKGVDFLKNLFGGDNWKKTSYNTVGGKYHTPNPEGGSRVVHSDQSKAFRANYAGIGSVYDPSNDVFHASQPYPSWTISGPEWKWQPPIARPDDNNFYEWNEGGQSWDIIEDS
tara:strand:+ start:188 stop:625 length:438 start_codon:yes stop_codon:yes gene_type:complete